MELLLCNEKLQRIKMLWYLPLLTRSRTHSVTEYFNTHFELIWAEMPQTECLTINGCAEHW